MSRLLLVRHGQAWAFEDDSDRLSELGAVQARRFGEWLRGQGALISEVRCGTLLRQRQTAELIAPAAPVIDERWNEFDAPGVLGRVAPVLAAQDAEFAKLAESSQAHRKGPDANRHFQRMFEVLMKQWVAGSVNADGVESWSAFQIRVRAALKDIVAAEGENRTVLVVASGGSIATAVQTVLRAPAETALELNWRMRNASLTEMLYSKGRVSLDLFNAVPHLAANEITYR